MSQKFSNTPASKRKKEFSYGKLALGTLIILFTILALGWLCAPISREEGFADSMRYPDVFKGILSHGPCWWTSDYMLGQHLATMYVAGLSIGCLSLGVTALGWVLGGITSLKLTVICFGALALLSMYAMIRRLGGSHLLGIVASGLYFLTPMMVVRGPIYEHFGLCMVFIFIPLFFRGIIAVAEKQSPAEIVFLGLAASGLALSYAKIAVILAPILILWTWATFSRVPQSHWQSLIKAYLLSLGVAFLCGFIPLLPCIQEFSNAAGFLFDPLQDWQKHFSFKTALSLIDPSNYFLRGMGASYESDTAFFHIGIIPLLFLSLGLSLPQLASWRKSTMGFWFLIMNASWIMGLWFASGPLGIMGGHLDLLQHARPMKDTSIPFLWFSLIWLLWIVWMTSKQLFHGQSLPAAIVTSLFLILPVFHFSEFIFSFFRNIRAPESFVSTSGFCCLVAGSALAAGELFTKVIPKHWRIFCAFIALCVMIVQLLSMFEIYTSRLLSKTLFQDYDAICQFLKTAPLQGRVHPMSGRYFYLTLPQKAQRGVDTEASSHHFQLRWVRYLEVAGIATSDAFKAYNNLAGVAYILLDKTDPFTPKPLQDIYRSLYPVAFENNSFALLANNSTLYPGFLAHDFVAFPMGRYDMAPAALQLANMNLATVEVEKVGSSLSLLGCAGLAKETNRIELFPQYQPKFATPFFRISSSRLPSDDPEEMIYRIPPNSSGWLVLTEAYHPDWEVTIDDNPAEVHCSEVALLSTYVPLGAKEVIFRFNPPFWYPLCLACGFLSWLVAIVALLYLPSHYAPSSWRAWWIGSKSSER